MDWVNITSLIILPIAGATLAKVMSFERMDAKLSAAIDTLNASMVSIWQEMKEHRERLAKAEARLLFLEKRNEEK